MPQSIYKQMHIKQALSTPGACFKSSSVASVAPPEFVISFPSQSVSATRLSSTRTEMVLGGYPQYLACGKPARIDINE